MHTHVTYLTPIKVSSPFGFVLRASIKASNLKVSYYEISYRILVDEHWYNSTPIYTETANNNYCRHLSDILHLSLGIGLRIAFTSWTVQCGKKRSSCWYIQLVAGSS